MSNWPTTKGLSPALDPEVVRRYLQDDLPKVWGARVDERMKALGLKNVQIAVLAGTTAQTVTKVRNGDIAPRDYLRVMLAAALATTPDALFPMPTMTEIGKRAAA